MDLSALVKAVSQLRSEVDLMKRESDRIKCELRENKRGMDIEEYSRLMRQRRELMEQRSVIEEIKDEVSVISKTLSKLSVIQPSSHDLWQHSLVLRNDFRSLFGEERSQQCGHFLDWQMNHIVHSFADWIDYPNKDQTEVVHHSGTTTAAVFSDYGRSLFISFFDGTMVIWDMIECVSKAQWNHEYVTMMVHHSGRLCCTGTNTIHVWDTDTLNVLHTLKGHTHSVTSLDVNRNGDRLVSASSDHSMRLWSLNTGDCLREFSDFDSCVSIARFIFDSIVSVCDGFVSEWSEESSEMTRDLCDEIAMEVDEMVVNCDGSLMVVKDMDDFGVTIYGWPTMEHKGIVKKNLDLMTFHPNHPYYLAVTDERRRILIFDVSSMKLLITLKGHNEGIVRMFFSPDGFRLISFDVDGSMHNWDVSPLMYETLVMG